jgi:hypothetical protein
LTDIVANSSESSQTFIDAKVILPELSLGASHTVEFVDTVIASFNARDTLISFAEVFLRTFVKASSIEEEFGSVTFCACIKMIVNTLFTFSRESTLDTDVS